MTSHNWRYQGSDRDIAPYNRADPEAVLPVFGYLRLARIDRDNVVIGPGSHMDVLGQSRRVAVYVDPLADIALRAIWLLREAFTLDHVRIAFHGETFTEKEH